MKKQIYFKPEIETFDCEPSVLANPSKLKVYDGTNFKLDKAIIEGDLPDGQEVDSKEGAFDSGFDDQL